MIQIRRGPIPSVLKGSQSSGDTYRVQAVVTALWAMQHGKCCYCEQGIPGEGHMKAVDHFRPKSVYKSRKNDWPNLLLACAQCNGKKSDKFPVALTDDSGQPKVLYLKKSGAQGTALLIDPSEPNIDPEDHIGFGVDDNDLDELGHARAKGGSQMGGATIEAVGLSSVYYVRRRRAFYSELTTSYGLLLVAENQGEDTMLNILKCKFAMLLSAKGRFAGFARAYARTKERALNALGVTIPTGAQLGDRVLPGATVAQARCKGTR